jgi:hypothetical protein
MNLIPLVWLGERTNLFDTVIHPPLSFIQPTNGTPQHHTALQTHLGPEIIPITFLLLGHTPLHGHNNCTRTLHPDPHSTTHGRD